MFVSVALASVGGRRRSFLAQFGMFLSVLYRREQMVIVSGLSRWGSRCWWG